MKIKKIIASLLAVGTVTMGMDIPVFAPAVPNISMTASAEEEFIKEEYGDFSINKHSDHIEISGYNGNSAEVEIPKEIDGLPVTSIDQWAFYGCSSLISITIPNSVTYIDSQAFWYTGLESVYIPESVTSMYISFNGCHNLKTIKVSENNQYFSSDKDGVLFNKDKTELLEYPTGKEEKSYSIPDSVTSISEYAFIHCTNLTSITIPNSVTNIGYCAFGISGLESVYIPESVTSMDIPFNVCDNLKTIKVSENNQYFSSDKDGVLFNKDKTELLQYPIGKEENSYSIPDFVTRIGNSAFNHCTNLTSITIPNSVTSVGFNAFDSCGRLKEITVPESVTSIGHGAFANLQELEKITILNPNCKIDDDSYTIYNTATIYSYDNSTAQAYAEKNERKFVSLGDAPAPELAMGDLNGDNSIDSSDASVVLIEYSLSSTGKESTLSAEQKAIADVDKDGKIDSSDASYILGFYSYISTGGTVMDMSQWMKNNS